MDPIKFGNFLSSLRNEKKLTQEQFAEKLNVSSKTVSKWECGNSIPDFETIINISKILNITLYELSNCEQIKSKKWKKEDILKIIDKKQLKKINMRRKIIYALIFIMSITFLISFIYTTNNYDRTQIYTLESLDQDFLVYGCFSKSKTFSVLSISKIDYIGKNNSFLSPISNDYNVELYSNTEKLYDFNKECYRYDKNVLTVNNILKKTNLLINNEENENVKDINNHEPLTLVIDYKDKNKNSKKKKLEINIKFIKKYSNTNIW